MIQTLHDGLARTLVLYLLAVGLWGLFEWRRGAGVSGSYGGALVLAEALAVVQGLLGVLLLAGQGVRDALHVLYGVAIVLTLPLAYTYARDKDARGQSLIYAIASLFAFGLAIRGIFTA